VPHRQAYYRTMMVLFQCNETQSLKPKWCRLCLRSVVITK
jgi:hypothetical protein